MKATPTVPIAVVELPMTGDGGLMLIVSVAVPVPPAFVALMVTLVEPVALGVPVIAPVLVFTEAQVGRPAAL